MTIKPCFDSATPIAELPEESGFLDDVLSGLSASPKVLSPKYFYDEAGSALFERITGLPEYYPTRTELRILDAHGPDIARVIPPSAVLVEFGSGSSLKLRRLLAHRHDLSAYVPVDVSAAFVRDQAALLRQDNPTLRIMPVVADFTKPFSLPAGLGAYPLAGFFPGSTIGNVEPEEAVRLLCRFGAILGPGAVLIVGVDLVKDRATLEAAYDDSAGVTAAFNLNMLTRINRELGGDFDLDTFVHRAPFNAEASRIEMHLESRVAQEVGVGGRRFRFRAGETIHTENSYKYTVEGFRDLAARAGWSCHHTWMDPAGLFSIHALRFEPVRQD